MHGTVIPYLQIDSLLKDNTRLCQVDELTQQNSVGNRAKKCVRMCVDW